MDYKPQTIATVQSNNKLDQKTLSPPESPDSGLSVSPSGPKMCCNHLKGEQGGSIVGDVNKTDPNNNNIEGNMECVVTPYSYNTAERHIEMKQNQPGQQQTEATSADIKQDLLDAIPNYDYSLQTPLDFEMQARYHFLSQQFAHLYAAQNMLAYHQEQLIKSFGVLQHGVGEPPQPSLSANSSLSVECSDHDLSTDSGRKSVSPPSLSPTVPEPSNKENVEASNVHSKPSHSYMALIAMAILNSPDHRLLLGDIYKFISDKFPYYRSSDRSWKSSVRHNLSLNECFVKSGSAANGKGYFWSIHPACIEDFARGDFRRRQARRRARKNTRDLSSNQSAEELKAPYPGPVGYVPMSSAPLNHKYHPYGRTTSARSLHPAVTELNRIYQPTEGVSPYNNISSLVHHQTPHYYPFYGGYDHYGAGYR